ncbi:hypothetical protein OIU85_004682 [Salix viminalis]|uniref:Uncharacterized protein n=1 Tax=Salix viminalis TaxID=40686 RepID=A0A9Q0SYA8_SALVM|nr:hypothetical protein OIU85_004682 [Salix viminalis]
MKRTFGILRPTSESAQEIESNVKKKVRVFLLSPHTTSFPFSGHLHRWNYFTARIFQDEIRRCFNNLKQVEESMADKDLRTAPVKRIQLLGFGSDKGQNRVGCSEHAFMGQDVALSLSFHSIKMRIFFSSRDLDDEKGLEVAKERHEHKFEIGTSCY